MTTGTTDNDDAQTRRTKTDVRYLAEHYGGTGIRTEAGPDEERNRRLRSHGWLTDDDETTPLGHTTARVTRVLLDRCVFKTTVQVLGGLPEYLNIVENGHPPEIIRYLNGVRTVANLIDESRHDAETQGVEYSHDGAFSRHFVAFDAKRLTVELRFNDKKTARAFLNWARDGWQVSYKHDARFGDDRNPRRLVVQFDR